MPALPPSYLHSSTPRCILRKDIAEKNANFILNICKRHNLKLRPHIKTHKTEEGALLQTGGKKECIVVSTLAEIRFYLDRGWKDLIYGVPLVGEDKIRFLVKIYEYYCSADSNDNPTVNLDDYVKITFDDVDQLIALEETMKRLLSKDEGGKKKSYKKLFNVQMMLSCGRDTSDKDTSDDTINTDSPSYKKRKLEDNTQELKTTVNLSDKPPKVHMHQVGLNPYADSTLSFAKKIQASPFCFLGGIYIHAAHSYSSSNAEECSKASAEERDSANFFYKKLRSEKVIHIEVTEEDSDSKKTKFIVGIGSTPTVSQPPTDGKGFTGGITELHAGNYLCFDTMQVGIGSCNSVENDCALRVKCRIISKSEHSNRLLIDLGWTGCSTQGNNVGFGKIVSHPELKVLSLKQETGEVGPLKDGEKLNFSKYKVGEVIELVSFHSCAVAHQYTKLFVEDPRIEGLKVEEWERCESK